MADTLEAQYKNPKTPTEEHVAALGPWFHNLELPDGTWTAPDHPLGDFPGFKWRKLASALPDDLTGWHALDIGCNAGYYAFELARRGATVTAIDVDSHYLRQARWVAQKYDLREAITFHQMQIYELAQLEGRFDLILFLGVFYHLRYPLLALDIVAEKVDRLLAFQTLTTPENGSSSPASDLSIEQREALEEPGWPRMAFVEGRMEGDPTNWWIPNSAAVESLLRSSGLRLKGRPGHEMYLCEPDSNFEGRETEQAIRAQYRAAAPSKSPSSTPESASARRAETGP